MYARVVFDGNQEFTAEEVAKIKETVADELDARQMYLKANGSTGMLYSWNETDNPDDPEIATGKKTLVTSVDKWQINSTKEYIINVELFLQKHPSVTFRMRGLPKVIHGDYDEAIAGIYRLQDKLQAALMKFNMAVEFNQRCGVHVGNEGLMSVNVLGYMTDACTEQLQEQLNNGWRLLAVCPQPDGRRPDYILGRYDPSGGGFSCAKF